MTLAEPLLPVLDDLDGVVDAAFSAGGEVSGPLRLDVVRVAMPYLARLVPGFLARYPRVRLEVASNDALVDIVALGYDAGIRLAERLEGDMIAVPFGGDLRMICVAAPDYLALHPAPVHPRDLTDHACMVTLTPSTGTPYRWEFEKDGEALRIAVDGPLVSRDPEVRVVATVAGVGIGFFFEDEVRALVATGALVQVLADWTPAFPGAYLYFPSRRNPAPPLRAFVDHVREMGRGQTFPEG